jgi:hypothetical protein
MLGRQAAQAGAPSPVSSPTMLTRRSILRTAGRDRPGRNLPRASRTRQGQVGARSTWLSVS